MVAALHGPSAGPPVGLLDAIKAAVKKQVKDVMKWADSSPEPPASLENCQMKCLRTDDCAGFDIEKEGTTFRRCFGKTHRSTHDGVVGREAALGILYASINVVQVRAAHRRAPPLRQPLFEAGFALGGVRRLVDPHDAHRFRQAALESLLTALAHRARALRELGSHEQASAVESQLAALISEHPEAQRALQ